MSTIEIKQLDVVFGKAQKQALALLDAGKGRHEIKQETGAVVGVEHADITIDEGEICVLMGLSGSGKSSLLRTINGLNPISRGQVLVQSVAHGQVDVASCSRAVLRHLRTDDVAMVFQKFALMPWLSVLDNVAFGLQMKGLSKAVRHKKAMEKLEIVGLRDWAKSKPHELSGGMQQRVGLARAFATESHILLMDEPFSALDPLIRTRLQDDLLDLQRELRKTIVFVSHDLDEALKLGTNIAIMQDGKIIQHNAPEEIVLNPATDYVRNFVMHTNPLNVLTAGSLMSEASKLVRDGERYYLSKQKRFWLKLDAAGRVVEAGTGERVLPIAPLGATEVGKMTFTQATTASSMRQVIEQRYDSLLPVLVVEGDTLLGVLNDNNFYYALLGKHFEEE